MNKSIVIAGLLTIGITACDTDSKAFDPSTVLADIKENGFQAPMYVELKEKCRDEKESGVVDGKHCYALKLTDERIGERISDAFNESLSKGGLEF